MPSPAVPGLILPFRGVHPTLAPDVFVAPGATVIGDVVIGEGAGIWFGCVIRGDVHSIRIGARTNVQDGTIVHVSQGTHPTHIGADITIGHGCVLHGCTLEDGCFIGMRSVILDGAVVESGAMVAAGALVTPGKRVKAGELWGGSPAKLLRPLTEADTKGWPASVAGYRALAAEYRAALG